MPGDGIVCTSDDSSHRSGIDTPVFAQMAAATEDVATVMRQQAAASRAVGRDLRVMRDRRCIPQPSMSCWRVGTISRSCARASRSNLFPQYPPEPRSHEQAPATRYAGMKSGPQRSYWRT